MDAVVKLDKNGQRRGGKRPGAGPKRRAHIPQAVGIELRDPRPLSLRARDLTHLALAGLVRTLIDPTAPHAAIVNAAREVLDRGYGKSVELKRTLTMGAFDGYSDEDLDILIRRLETIEHPGPTLEGTADKSGDPPLDAGLGEERGTNTSAPSSDADRSAAAGGGGQDR